MSLFDDFSVNARTYAGKVSRKADAAVEISRLKLTESRLSREISKSLKLLGAKVYKAYSINDSALEVGTDVELIRDMYDRLKTIRTQINELKKSEFSSSSDKTDESQE
ncbi:MAG: hypothetical protein IKK10_05600 [Clostridia bacterium]|nr:hypothetical protein [Clostridia bacterium]